MRQRVTVGATGAFAGAVLAANFAEAWRRRIMKAFTLGAENPANDARVALGSRLDSIAITESARSFNAERQALATKIKPASGNVVIKRWDAALDACEFCALMDGTVVLASDFFSGGEPGNAHPRCRCLAHYEEVSRLEFYMLAA